MKDSSFGRLLGVLLSPGETFRSIEARPTWVAPLLVLLLLGGAVGFLVQIRSDPEEMVRGQLSSFKMEIPQEKVEEMIRDAEGRSTGAKIGLSALGVTVQGLVYALLALIFLGALRMFGSEVDYVRCLAVTLHGYMPGALAALINVPILMGRSTITYEEATQGGVLVSSLAAFAPEGASATLRALLGSVDLFSIWTVILLSLGFKIVGKVSTTVSTVIVVLLWLIYLGGKLGLAALFAR